jgi:hypothetical protein
MDLKSIYNSAGQWMNNNLVKPAMGISNYYAAPKAEAAPTSYNLGSRGVQISDADIQAMRPLLYGELSNRSPDKQTLEAHVIMNTALNRMKDYAAHGQPKTLSQVVAMPNQYQAYGGPQYKAYTNPTDAPSIAKKKQVDAIVDALQGQIRSGIYPDTTNGAYYYSHDPATGKITYDDKRRLFAD